jgi:hypothetical protein
MQGKYLIVYHSRLGFRASPIQMLLLDAGVEFEMREPEWGEDRVVAGNPGLPVFAPPVLRKGDFVLSQTCAIMNYLGSIHGYTPTGRVPLPLSASCCVCVMCLCTPTCRLARRKGLVPAVVLRRWRYDQ